MLGRLKNLLSMLQSSGASVVGVDMGSAYVKIVQLRRKSGKAVLETYGSLALGPYAGLEIGRATNLHPEKLAEALRDILREAHATSLRAAFAIPFASSLVTIMPMRVFDEKQLPDMVPIEARKYVPVPISEVNLDWWIIPEAPKTRGSPPEGGIVSSTHPAVLPMAAPLRPAVNDSSGMDPKDRTMSAPQDMTILITAIHNDALNRYREIADGSGLQSRFFEIELFSTIRSLFPQDLDAHAVLDAGAGGTKLYILDKGLIRLSHIMNHGGQDITLSLSRALGISVEEAEKMKRREGLATEGGESHVPLTAVLNVIFSEASRTIQNFEHKSGRKVKDIILSGGGANLKGIFEVAQQHFLVPVERANPFQQVEVPAFLEDMLKEAGPEFTVALGIAFRELQDGG